MFREMRIVLVAVVAVVVLALPKSAHAQTAWGGGCQNGSGTDTCMALVWPTLSADFYVNDWSATDSSGFAQLYVCVVGNACYFKYAAYTYFTGHYPTAYHDISGSGSAFTVVDFYDSSSNNYAERYSPYQYWSS